MTVSSTLLRCDALPRDSAVVGSSKIRALGLIGISTQTLFFGGSAELSHRALEGGLS